jgi:hypothetical protein
MVAAFFESEEAEKLPPALLQGILTVGTRVNQSRLSICYRFVCAHLSFPPLRHYSRCSIRRRPPPTCPAARAGTHAWRAATSASSGDRLLVDPVFISSNSVVCLCFRTDFSLLCYLKSRLLTSAACRPARGWLRCHVCARRWSTASPKRARSSCATHTTTSA